MNNPRYTLYRWFGETMQPRLVSSIDDLRALVLCSTTRAVQATARHTIFMAYENHVKITDDLHKAGDIYYYGDLRDKQVGKLLKLKWLPLNYGRWESPLKALSRTAE